MKRIFILIGLVILVFIVFYIISSNKEYFEVETKCEPGFKKVMTCVKDERKNIEIIDKAITELVSIDIKEYVKNIKLEELNKLKTHVQKILEDIQIYQPENNEEADKKTKAINLINEYLKIMENEHLNKSIEQTITKPPQDKLIVRNIINQVLNINIDEFKKNIINADINILSKLKDDTDKTISTINNFSPNDDEEISNKKKALNVMAEHKLLIQNELEKKPNIIVDKNILDFLYDELVKIDIQNISNNYSDDQFREFRNKLMNLNENVNSYQPKNEEEKNKKVLITSILRTYNEMVNTKLNR